MFVPAALSSAPGYVLSCEFFRGADDRSALYHHFSATLSPHILEFEHVGDR